MDKLDAAIAATEPDHIGHVTAEFVNGVLTTLTISNVGSFQLFGVAEMIRHQGQRMLVIEDMERQQEQRGSGLVVARGLPGH